MMAGHDCDLLIVGLGPVGDTLAALARLSGLSVIAIERSTSLYPLPRAAVFDQEIMRIMQMIGVAERIEPHTRVATGYQFLTAAREVLLDFAPAKRGPFGWAESYTFHQPAFEAVLRDRLDEVGVDVRTGVSFIGLAEDNTGIVVTVETGGERSTIRARYIVGCDGAWSPVREALGIELFDFGFDEPWLVLDTTIDAAHAPPIVAQQICDPARPITHLAMTSGRFRWEFMLKPGEDPDELASDVRIRELVAPWGCSDHMVIERKAIYRFHGLVAKKWRSGRALIAGDSAHQMPPFAGQGMCSGIRDAANLAWKLAAVINDGADEAILDTYQEEREPHVRATIETAIAMGRVVCILDEDGAAERNRNMLARRAAGEQAVSLDRPALSAGLLFNSSEAGSLMPQPSIGDARFDDLLGLHAALVGWNLPLCDDPSIRTVDLESTEATPFGDALKCWLESAGATAALIRPDRHVFGTGDPSSLLVHWYDMTKAKKPVTNNECEQ